MGVLAAPLSLHLLVASPGILVFHSVKTLTSFFNNALNLALDTKLNKLSYYYRYYYYY